MDLILSILLLVGISSYKILNKTDDLVPSIVVDDYGIESEIVVKESTLVVGKNLMLLKEPRAYHKILDEMGLM